MMSGAIPYNMINTIKKIQPSCTYQAAGQRSIFSQRDHFGLIRDLRNLHEMLSWSSLEEFLGCFVYLSLREIILQKRSKIYMNSTLRN